MRYNVFMKTIPFWFLFPIFFAGCFNERGVSLRYYSDCEEYYDLQGYYHKKCDQNLVDYADVKEALMTPESPERGSVR